MHGGYAAPSELDGKIHSAVKLDCIICAKFLELFAFLCGQPFQQFFLPCCIFFFVEKRKRGEFVSSLRVKTHQAPSS